MIISENKFIIICVLMFLLGCCISRILVVMTLDHKYAKLSNGAMACCEETAEMLKQIELKHKVHHHHYEMDNGVNGVVMEFIGKTNMPDICAVKSAKLIDTTKKIGMIVYPETLEYYSDSEEFCIIFRNCFVYSNDNQKFYLHKYEFNKYLQDSDFIGFELSENKPIDYKINCTLFNMKNIEK